ncbi:MAG TPA: 5-deoxy-glucuronate isomerase [Halieaceae bacterium]|jgi:5-deoxy-glucuronate isomerase|uniref:5-deoxy-glucuronate isomerase n=1 Tax=Haliea TaxID=475794 RepID=UPI000C412A6B|nr:5-deoxy-glucuronate isomerase [Haliea sp.]HAN69578.1 5-deoxy-glucuronate isomerase [Halieaceae bacterium]MAD63731.1 5-deoxy-glucuronate isomerase [Haliea sp.]MAY92092.1 5-deoxy-glucuronate isomerase [Haliea sp.]MBK42016.1 5-deoxy-glucuronate isomerase [Haliea sp.]HBQ41998.1 5-deoxy-glucuronate isomerase [Halieaceae bacterium]|tara:strand:- start:5465 stop:6265 length:801 start_codon:yes stop_codon:yes gene_type:complete
MPQLLSRRQTPDKDGLIQHVTPESAGWRYVGFDCFELAAGRSVARHSGDRELCLVLVGGRASVRAGDQSWESIGERSSPFEGVAPYAVYVPPRCDYTVTAETDLELAVCSAPASGRFPARLIRPQDCERSERGSGSNRRLICNILFGNLDAESLLVVEVITPNGNWSSYPPHKHDTDDAPRETHLEETYYHRLSPPQGFAFQRVYTDDRSLDETMAVENGDVVMVPRGYHPVGAPHGYDLYYLNVMAGPKRKWIFQNDPEHEWMLK